MAENTLYYVSCGPSPRSYAMGFGCDGNVTSWTGKKHGAKPMTKEAACAAAQHVGEWLIAHGYGKAAPTLRVGPMFGTETGWRFKA